MRIDIITNGTKKLLTEGKLCRENIELNVNVAGGGGEPLEPAEIAIEPYEILENTCFDRDNGLITQENCDFYQYHIHGMFGGYVRIRFISPQNGTLTTDDYDYDIHNKYNNEEDNGDYEVDEAFPITCNDFEIGVSCVRTDGLPQVAVSFKGIVVEKEPDYTACFDGTMSGEYVDSKLTSVRFGGFAGTNFTKISLPNCVELKGNRQFTECLSLEEVELPKVSNASLAYSFNNTSKLKKIVFPELEYTTDTGACFYGCSELKRAEFPKLSGTTIGNYAFRNCSVLEVIILGGAVLCPLNNTNAFSGCNNAIIYVPDNLVTTYQGADNWKTYASRIKGLSQLPAEEEEE